MKLRSSQVKVMGCSTVQSQSGSKGETDKHLRSSKVKAMGYSTAQSRLGPNTNSADQPINTLGTSVKNSLVQSNHATSNVQDIMNIGKMVNTVMNEVICLRNTFVIFQKSVGQSIDMMNATINAKSKDYVVVTGTLQNEIDSIKKSLKINGELMKKSNLTPMDTRFTHILHGQALMQIEYEYAAQLEQLQNKVNEIEAANKQTAGMVNDLVTSISSFMNTDSCEYQHDTETVEKIGDIENAIECIQHELNGIKTSSFGDGEKIIKMDKQIHVLSAKYVDFNIKVNHHLLDYNRKKLNKIDADKIIDDDTKPFMEVHDDINDNGAENKCVPKNNISSRRFVRPYVRTDYTRIIRVEINNTQIKDLEKFKYEFATEFERYIGKNVVKRITINKYRLHENVVKSISCVVEFMIPLNFDYINNHKFPVNWDFLPMNRQRQANEVMTSWAENTT